MDVILGVIEHLMQALLPVIESIWGLLLNPVLSFLGVPAGVPSWLISLLHAVALVVNVFMPSPLLYYGVQVLGSLYMMYWTAQLVRFAMQLGFMVLRNVGSVLALVLKIL